MVFGRTGQERLQLNEDTLAAGSPYNPDNPDALLALAEVRQLLAEGKYQAAESLAGASMMARPLAQMSYGTLGDLLLDFTSHGTPVDYERSLDLSSAVARMRCRTPLGRVRREAFVSAPDQLIAVRLEGARGTLDFDLSYAPPGAISRPAPKFAGPATDIAALPAVDWRLQETIDRAKRDAQVTGLAPDTLLITGRNEAAGSIPAGLRFAVAVKLVTDGTTEVHGDVIRHRGATMSAATRSPRSDGNWRRGLRSLTQGSGGIMSGRIARCSTP
jgi:alpha-L-fucosidase 2